MSQWVMVLNTELDDLKIQMWKGRTNFSKLSSDLHVITVAHRHAHRHIYTQIKNSIKNWARKTSQWLECFLYEQKDLSLDCQNPLKCQTQRDTCLYLQHRRD